MGYHIENDELWDVQYHLFINRFVIKKQEKTNYKLSLRNCPFTSITCCCRTYSQNRKWPIAALNVKARGDMNNYKLPLHFNHLLLQDLNQNRIWPIAALNVSKRRHEQLQTVPSLLLLQGLRLRKNQNGKWPIAAWCKMLFMKYCV